MAAPLASTHRSSSRARHSPPGPGRTLLLALALLASAGMGACRPAASGAPPAMAPSPSATGRGTLFLVGGGPQPPELVREFVRLAGGADARVVVLAMASAGGERSGEAKAAELRALGAQARNLWITREQASLDSVARLLDDATGVWFGGGDQSRLMGVLRDTPVERAIRRRWLAGAAIGGTSAGAAVMSSPMITGEERRRGGRRAPADSAADGFITIARENVVTTAGLGFVDGAIVDQHFVRRRRHNRLMSLVLEGPIRLGVGIDESTALVVHPDGRWSVLGESAAIVYDARRAVVTAPGAESLGAANVTVHVLPAGSRFDPASGRATLP